MARTPRRPPATHWSIRSIHVRKRDGPGRLEQAYLLLLDGRHDPSSSQPDNQRSQNHARRDLRPGIDGTPGARADD
jgi:hypothetical protein